MRRPTRLWTRNKFVDTINNWQQLGAIVHEFSSSAGVKKGRDRNRFKWRLVVGVARDGRAILIYPIMSKMDRIPRLVCDLMMEYEQRGAIVGCAENIGDCWDLVFSDESQHKRKQRTYLHKHWSEEYAKGRHEQRDSEE